MQLSRSLFAALTAVALLVASLPSPAQMHRSTSGRCSLRSSTVDSRSVAPSVAARRGFPRSADVAIVDVTVSCKGRSGNGTVSAHIDVTKADLAGTKEPVAMHEDRQNGYVSYYGTYRHVRGQIVQLAVSATPRGKSHQMKLTYRHRFVVR